MKIENENPMVINFSIKVMTLIINLLDHSF
jgi:hypothetical protein